MDDEAEIKEKIAKACRIMYYQGWRETYEGHISYRVPGTDRVYIPAHQHSEARMKCMGDLTPEDITMVYLDGRETGLPEAMAELPIHTSIYKLREDVLSVAHCHPFFSTTLSCTKGGLVPLSRHAALFPGGVLLFDAGTQLVTTPEVGRRLAVSLGGRFAALIRGHGIVTVGASIEETLFRIDWLERAAKLQFVASQMGQLNLYTWGELEAGRFVERGQARAAWRYYEQKLIEEGKIW